MLIKGTIVLIARDEFERFKDENPETLTDIQRAVRFYFVLKNSFSARIKNPSFSISTQRLSAFNLLRVEEELRRSIFAWPGSISKTRVMRI
jgi:DNA adenine methylase